MDLDSHWSNPLTGVHVSFYLYSFAKYLIFWFLWGFESSRHWLHYCIDYLIKPLRHWLSHRDIQHRLKLNIDFEFVIKPWKHRFSHWGIEHRLKFNIDFEFVVEPCRHWVRLKLNLLFWYQKPTFHGVVRIMELNLSLINFNSQKQLFLSSMRMQIYSNIKQIRNNRTIPRSNKVLVLVYD